MIFKRQQVALLLTFGRLSSGFKPTPKPNGALKARNDCTAPCGWSNQFYTQECCGDNSICIMNAFNSGTCGPRDTVYTSIIGGTPTTIETTIVQTSTVTATQQARTSPSPTSTSISSSSTTSASDTASAASATTSSTLEPRQDNSEWPLWKKIAVGAGSGVGLVLIAAAVIFFIWKERKSRAREDGARDNASSMFARVSPHRHSRQELDDIRGEAVDEVAPPEYDNSAPNPFSGAAFARSRSQQLNKNARAARFANYNELPAMAFSSDGRSERSIPRRAVAAGYGSVGRHSGIGPVLAPPASRVNIRPDHDFSPGR